MEGDSSRDPGTSDGSGATTSRGEDAESNLFRIDGESLFVGLGTICDTAARLTGVDGAAVAVLTGDVRELVHATDALAQQIDELQFTLGEGPCLQAYAQDHDELWPSIEDREFARRWPLFTAEVLPLGVAAVFAFPVAGATRPMGVLELYRRTPGALAPSELHSARTCSTAISDRLGANWQSQVQRSGGALAAVEAVGLHDGSSTHVDDRFTRGQVHIAAGMVAVQLKVSTQDGMTRLRAHAYAERRSVVAVAADVVSRRLSFRDLDDDAGPGTGR
ncbi:GAF domain-containing protein [Mycolicibacterium sp. P9-22]|uniref:GAF domain-containing protein n=1 Tax=Mycolicibacterium sp. P9-22 TaxID=2024613 RepID=UPI0011EEB930|nr:GAF domain-containing protein [Mycolicibacterium sp. P9-22]KAA0111506.1 GAF domain-containing protein [Mycolicibacterium sp. P9-22]